MMRLAISVEGATEREFVSRVLAPHLRRAGWAEVKPVDIGGNVSLDKIARALLPLLGSFAHVTTLYDFYGFKRRGGRGVEALEAAIAESVPVDRQRRLTPYVQLHEFEALLFASPAQTNEWMGGKPAHLAALQEALDECGHPEGINDRPETSPSHRLLAQYPHFDKKLHGPDIVELIGLAAVRQACLRFNRWIAQLEQLARQSA
jgi:hypothetical protein